MIFLYPFFLLLKPFAPFEKEEGKDQNQEADPDHNGIAKRMAIFRHGKIHAIPSCNKRERHKNCGDDRQNFHDLVHVQVYFRLICLADFSGVIPEVACFVQKPRDLFARHADFFAGGKREKSVLIVLEG